jgi:DNA-directed RNA polymerase specialized sigma24 family protein
MEPHPDDLTATDDLTLVEEARAGNRLAFGVLYLRHHAAAWRIACVATRFSPDAELAVIEGFTRVFSALPENSEDFASGGVSFRPYLLACVRQAALDRALAAGRAEARGARPSGPGRGPASPPPPAPLAGLGPDGEVVLSDLEHHVARGALAALAEQSRTALWLSDVEALTPGEVAGVLDSSPDVVAGLVADARADVRAAQAAALRRHEVRADCRFTVGNLDTFHAGTLDPKKGVLVRSHLDLCPPCRMRLAERANAPAALAATVPSAPLLGGEAQQHWLTAGAVRPAERLLPPGVAAAAQSSITAALAAGPPLAALSGTADPLRAPGWTGTPGASGSPVPSLPPTWTIPPGRATTPNRRDRRDRRTRRLALVPAEFPAVSRQVGRTVWPAVPAMALVVAWLGVMLALPHLMEPRTAPGPDGLALPAVQAYVPGYLPGAAHPEGAQPGPLERGAGGPTATAAPFAEGVDAGGTVELAAQLTDTARGSAGSGIAEATARLIPAAVPPAQSGPSAPSIAPAVAAATPAAAPVDLSAAAPISVLAVPSAPTGPDQPASPPAKPGKNKSNKPAKDTKPRQDATRAPKAEPQKDSKKAKASERTKQPASRRIVTA